MSIFSELYRCKIYKSTRHIDFWLQSWKYIITAKLRIYFIRQCSIHQSMHRVVNYIIWWVVTWLSNIQVIKSVLWMTFSKKVCKKSCPVGHKKRIKSLFRDTTHSLTYCNFQNYLTVIVRHQKRNFMDVPWQFFELQGVKIVSRRSQICVP